MTHTTPVPTWLPSAGSLTVSKGGDAPLVGNAHGDIVIGGRGTEGPNALGPLVVKRRPAGGVLDGGAFPGDGPGATTTASSFLTPNGTAITAYAPLLDGTDRGRPVSWTHGAGQAWGLPEDIGLDPGDVTLAGDATGALTALGRLGGVSAVVSWSGGWQAPQTTPAGAGYPAMAVGGAGVTTLVWAGTDGRLRTASAQLPGAFGPTTELGPGNGDGKLVAGADGSAAYVWVEPGPVGSGSDRLMGVLRDEDGSWGTAAVVPGGSTGAAVPDFDVAIDGTGLATVVWTRGADGAGTVLAVQGRAGAGFGAPATLHETNQVTPSVAVGANAKGDVVAVVGTYVFGNNWAAGYTKAPGTAWSGALLAQRDPVRAVQTAGEVVVDDQGNAAASVRDEGSQVTGTFDVYGYDAAGPRLGGLVIPATAEVGRAFGIDGEATDVWSSVATLTWDFGDGTAPVTGAHPSHAYTTRGTRTITVTARDTVGNVSTRTATVRVTEPSRPVLDDLRVDPAVLDPAAGAVLRGELSAPISGSLQLFRLNGTRLQPVSTLPLSLPAGTLALPLRGSLAQQLGAGIYVLLLSPVTPAGANAAATLFVVR